jgi:hypothetical protein
MKGFGIGLQFDTKHLVGIATKLTREKIFNSWEHTVQFIEFQNSKIVDVSHYCRISAFPYLEPAIA